MSQAPDFIEPLLPTIDIETGMTPAEVEALASESLLRQRVAEQWLKGEAHEDDLNDLLREARIEPDEYWSEVEETVERFIDWGIRPSALEFLDSGLVIPRDG